MALSKDLIGTYLALRTDLLRFLKARLGEPAGAEDLYQEMYLRLQSTELADSIGEPRAFLYKMAGNLANDRARTARRRDARERDWQDSTTQRLDNATVADVPDIAQTIDSRRELNRVMNWIAAMPPRCREVFTLHSLRGLPHLEVASRLGISIKAVEKQMANAYRILAEKAADAGGRGTGKP